MRSQRKDKPVQTELPQTRSCFACGGNHPFGLCLKMTTDGTRVFCRWKPSNTHTGFSHAIHGGLIATVLDEMMAWACGIVGGKFAYSAEMTIRYHNILEPGDLAECTGALVENRRNRIFKTSAVIHSKGRDIASSEGKYIPLKDFTLDGLKQEFGDGWKGIAKYTHPHE